MVSDELLPISNGDLDHTIESLEEQLLLLQEDTKSLEVSSLVTFDSCHLIAEVTTPQVKTLRDKHIQKPPQPLDVDAFLHRLAAKQKLRITLHISAHNFF